MKSIFPNSMVLTTQSNVARTISLTANAGCSRDCFGSIEKKNSLSSPGFHCLDTTFYHLKMSYLSLSFAHDIQYVLLMAQFSLVCETAV